jgi:hypothetical protein
MIVVEIQSKFKVKHFLVKSEKYTNDKQTNQDHCQDTIKIQVSKAQSSTQKTHTQNVSEAERNKRCIEVETRSITTLETRQRSG